MIYYLFNQTTYKTACEVTYGPIRLCNITINITFRVVGYIIYFERENQAVKSFDAHMVMIW